MNLELNKALYNISALADLGQEITSLSAFNSKLEAAYRVVAGTFLASRGGILLFDRQKEQMIPLAKQGIDEKELSRLSLDKILLLEKNKPNYLGEEGRGNGLGLELIVPLWVRDEFVGALLLGGKFTGAPFGSDETELLGIIAHQVAVALNNHTLVADLAEKMEENRRLYEEMRHIYHRTLQAFAAAIDAKDAYTKNHSHRVAKYSAAVARELGWSEDEIEGIYIAGYLHDVGKLAISDNILNKVTPFTAEELDEIRKHSTVSHEITSKIKFPWKNIEDIVWHHHERLDGGGYPEALDQSSLSDGVRIITLTDSFDAMTSQRPYRKKLPVSTALAELKKYVHTQFDNRILLAFCRVLDREIKGEPPEADILPHVDISQDIQVISKLLEGIIKELSSH